jgi:hypothetical protein
MDAPRRGAVLRLREKGKDEGGAAGDERYL